MRNMAINDCEKRPCEKGEKGTNETAKEVKVGGKTACGHDCCTVRKVHSEITAFVTWFEIETSYRVPVSLILSPEMVTKMVLSRQATLNSLPMARKMVSLATTATSNQ
jgi:hypothetical protein